MNALTTTASAVHTTQALGQMLHATLGQQQSATETAARVQKTYEGHIAVLEQENRNLARQLQLEKAQNHQLRSQKATRDILLRAELDQKRVKWEQRQSETREKLAAHRAESQKPKPPKPPKPPSSRSGSPLFNPWYSDSDDDIAGSFRQVIDNSYEKSLTKQAEKLKAIAERRIHYGV